MLNLVLNKLQPPQKRLPLYHLRRLGDQAPNAVRTILDPRTLPPGVFLLARAPRACAINTHGLATTTAALRGRGAAAALAVAPQAQTNKASS